MSDEKIVQAQDLVPTERMVLTDILKELHSLFGVSKSTFPMNTIQQDFDDIEKLIEEHTK